MNSRRDFIYKITAASAMLPFIKSSNYFMSKTNNDDRILRVAIMGLGNYGTRVADSMQSCKKAKLVGAISGTPSKLLAWQTKYQVPAGNCYNYENYDNIKDNPDIDAVYIITPNALHHDGISSLVGMPACTCTRCSASCIHRLRIAARATSALKLTRSRHPESSLSCRNLFVMAHSSLGSCASGCARCATRRPCGIVRTLRDCCRSRRACTDN